MTERSLRVLEFNKIRAQLAQYCVSDMGRALCDALVPAKKLGNVQRMQQDKRGDGKSQNRNDQGECQPAVGKAESCDLLLRLNFLFLF